MIITITIITVIIVSTLVASGWSSSDRDYRARMCRALKVKRKMLKSMHTLTGSQCSLLSSYEISKELCNGHSVRKHLQTINLVFRDSIQTIISIVNSSSNHYLEKFFTCFVPVRNLPRDLANISWMIMNGFTNRGHLIFRP